MGWCHEFGPQIRPGCDHPMVAGSNECHCVTCGASCEGRFGGCEAVWSRGATGPAVVTARPAPAPAPAPAKRTEGASGGGAPTHRPEAPEPPPAPPATAVRPVDTLQAVASALETVGAELRAMRNAIDSHSESAGSGPAEPVAARLAELIDGFPARMQAAIREALAQAAGTERRSHFAVGLRTSLRDRLGRDDGSNGGRHPTPEPSAPVAPAAPAAPDVPSPRSPDPAG